jgi:hypothetical protein
MKEGNNRRFTVIAKNQLLPGHHNSTFAPALVLTQYIPVVFAFCAGAGHWALGNTQTRVL